MFHFLEDMNAPILMYDDTVEEYVFIGRGILEETYTENLVCFKEKYCGAKSVFAVSLAEYRNGTYDPKRRHYFFLNDPSGATLCYEVRLTSPSYEGKTYMVFAFYEYTQAQRLKMQLESYRINQAMIASLLLGVSEDCGESLIPQHLIATLGIALNVSRVMILDFDRLDCPNEWCNENIKLSNSYRLLQREYFEKLREAFANMPYIAVESTENVPEEYGRHMELSGIKSIAAYPIYANGHLFGAVVLHDCIGTRRWRFESETMQAVTAILSGVIAKKRKLAEIRRREKELKTVLDGLPFYVYINDYATHEILFANSVLKKSLQRDPEGLPCWVLVDSEGNGPCAFCKMQQTVDAAGNPFQSVVSKYASRAGQDYRIYSCAIHWFDERIVHLACMIPTLGKEVLWDDV